MKTVLLILAGVTFVSGVIALVVGVLLGQLPLGIAAFVSGLVLAAILYAQSDIVESLDVLAENQKRLIKAFNARERKDE